MTETAERFLAMKTIAMLILFVLTVPAGADDIARRQCLQGFAYPNEPGCIGQAEKNSRESLAYIPGTHLRIFACVHDVCWQVNDIACPTPDNDVCAFIEGKRK